MLNLYRRRKININGREEASVSVAARAESLHRQTLRSARLNINAAYLMGLELRRNNIKTYIKASIVICVLMIGVLYLFAYAPHKIPEDLELRKIVGNYNNLFTMFLTIGMVAYAVLASVMQSRFVIEEYKEKRAVLLFSYPVNRIKILCAKLAVVFLFVVVAMILSNLLAFVLFGISESITPLVGDGLSSQMILNGIKLSSLLAIAASGIGVISAGIGFFANRSVPAAIVSSMVLAALISNLTLNAVFNSSNISSDALFIGAMLLSVAAGIVSTGLLAVKIKNMEV